MPQPFTIFDVRITVVAIEGRSVCGLTIGDYFDVVNSSQVQIPAGKHFCLYAMAAIMPLIPAKQRQLAAADWLERDTLIACPDPEERLIMQIERINQRVMDSEELT